MKVEFSIDKCWDECVRPATMDDVRMAILEILTFLPGEANFYFYPNNRDTVLWVQNNLMVHFADEEGESKICSSALASVTELELVCSDYLNQYYEKVFVFLEARNCNKLIQIDE